MTYREEDKSRLKRQVSKHAVALAMQGRWQEVVVANKALLETFPDDIDAFNRLGRAYVELGEYALARKHTQAPSNWTPTTASPEEPQPPVRC